ncbi:MAG: c-type cytochrome domain-containing protein, partial [Bryobacteraceae bacterium]
MRAQIFIIAFGLPLAAAAQDASSPPAPSFAKDVAPIFAKNCAACHSANTKMGGLDLETWEGIEKGGAHGAIIAPGKSEESRLYLMVAGKAKPAMPMGGEALAAGEIEAIRKWIDAGAKPPKPGEVIAKKTETKLPEIKPTTAVKHQVFALAWNPDGKTIALAGYKQVRLVDAATNKTVATLEGHAETVRAVAFSSDGTRLAAAGGLPGRKGEVKIWDVAKREVAATINGHADCIYAVAFSPDGKWVATSSYDKLIKLWDAASGQEVRT